MTIPAPLTLYCRLIQINTEVIASAATEFASAPAADPAARDDCGELDDRVTSVLVVAEDEHVALGAPARVELGGPDIVKGRDDAHIVAEQPFGGQRGRPVRGKVDGRDFRGNQRHDGVDDDLALNRRFDLLDRLVVAREGHREHDNVRAARRADIVLANDREAGLGGEVGRLVARAGSDDHPIARPGPTQSETRAEVARSPDDPDDRLRGVLHDNTLAQNLAGRVDPRRPAAKSYYV